MFAACKVGLYVSCYVYIYYKTLSVLIVIKWRKAYIQDIYSGIK